MPPDPSNPLIVGAAAISREAFQGKLSQRQVYRLAADGWPIFRLRGKLVARASTLRAHIERLEREASAPAPQPAQADG